jgi:hypothetical protein
LAIEKPSRATTRILAAVKLTDARIPTTHVGSLVRPPELPRYLKAIEQGLPSRAVNINAARAYRQLAGFEGNAAAPFDDPRHL